jgi:hypothetical protein
VETAFHERRSINALRARLALRLNALRTPVYLFPMSFRPIIWNQYLGKPECPYMRRWVLNLGLFSIRLHQWFAGDDDRALHDHSWDFWVWVLRGSYMDISKSKGQMVEQLMVPSWRPTFRKAEHAHTVQTKGCWTLLLTGPERRAWGFFMKLPRTGHVKWVKASRYFRKRGHHPCSSS